MVLKRHIWAGQYSHIENGDGGKAFVFGFISARWRWDMAPHKLYTTTGTRETMGVCTGYAWHVLS